VKTIPLVLVTVFASALCAQDRDAIDITLPYLTGGENTLRLIGGFSSRAGSYIGLSDSTDNLLGLGETLHLNAEIGMRLRHIEFGFTEPSLRGKAIQYGVTLYGDRFHFNQVHESSILAFERDISVFSQMDPGDPVDYTQTGYGVKAFVEHPL
jgi:outer membrane protein insertion porin family